jgi:hypothetical protein
MFQLPRRQFLGSSVAGLAAAMTASPLLFAADSKKEKSSDRSSKDTSGHDTLFLTWQRDPTTTITAQWVAAESSADQAIHYAPLKDKDWQAAKTATKPFVGTDLKVYRCELTGLTPGTEYKFRIGDLPAEHRFRTMPAKATDTIQFVSGGDAGTGEHAIATNKIAAAQEPYFALMGGDLAYDNGRSPGTFQQFLRNYSEHMIDPQGRMIPLISCLGNHEVSSGYKTRREGATSYLSVFDGFYPEKTFGVLDIGDYLSLVLLDTEHVAPIAGEQTDWLARVLADRQSRSHLLVANHVPAYPSYRAIEAGGKGAGAGNRQHWSPLFEKYNVDAVLEHHDHTFKRTHPLTGGLKDKNGVLYLGDGSWGKLRAPHTPAERPYLAAVGQAYHMTVHRLEGEHRFHIALEESGKVADVCMTVNKRPARRG